MPTEFQNKIYETLRKVPKGKVTTYKELANALKTKAYQSIGTAMKVNPYAPIVPCHRVVKNNGSVGFFKGKKEGKAITEKINMLKKEGIVIKEKKIINFKEKLHKF